MKLITQELKKRFEQLGNQEEREDPLVVTKFFNPSGGATWYVTEYLPKENSCFGYVEGLVPGGDEWGYFSIKELEALRCPPFGLPIERDLHFAECAFSEIKKRRLQ